MVILPQDERGVPLTMPVYRGETGDSGSFGIGTSPSTHAVPWSNTGEAQVARIFADSAINIIFGQAGFDISPGGTGRNATTGDLYIPASTVTLVRVPAGKQHFNVKAAGDSKTIWIGKAF